MPGSPLQDRPIRSRAASRRLLAAALAAALAACQRDQVTHVEIPKEAAAALPSPASAGAPPAGSMPPGMGGDVPPPPSPDGGAKVQWTLPRGWTQSLSGGMRYATLKAPVPGKLDVSVVVLPGPAGGELANVNRWRGQIGLPPVDEAALAGARQVVRSGAGPVSLYEFTSEGQRRSRIVAGLVEVAGNTWFVKMVGDAEPASAARPDFLRLVESLRLETATR